jgi:hypothetical protein
MSASAVVEAASDTEGILDATCRRIDATAFDFT